MRPKADAARIDALERELGISEPALKPLAEVTGYVVLMDSKDREVSDRARVTFTVGPPRQVGDELKIDIRINGGSFTLTPTRWGLVRAIAVLDTGGTMPACYPDWPHQVRSGDTFTITP